MFVLLVILLQIVVHWNGGAHAVIDHPDDAVALVTIFNSTSGPSWSNNSGWLEWIARPQSLSFCSVFGVTNCSTVGPHRRLISLNLASNNLRGSILASTWSSTLALRNLNLAGNRLSGTIPQSLGRLLNLEELDLSSNQLTGTIPPSLGDLTALKILHLFANMLSGTIPAALGSLVSLIRFDLSTNKLFGSIPFSLGNFSQVQYFDVDMNQLTGTIPSSFENLISVQRLYLYNNLLTGTISSYFGNLSNLVRLTLNSNRLSGTIPSSLGNLPNLERLFLHGNLLTGSIPDSLGNLSQLVRLALDSNQLTGTIPQSLGNIITLERLYLHSNQLSGTIPSSLSALPVLELLDLSTNQLIGTIPSSFGNFAALQLLDLDKNQLTGTILDSLGNIASLKTVFLFDNFFTGTIPPSLGNLSQLESLYLNSNQLSGTIPLSFLNLSSIQSLYFGNNLLVGPFPTWLNSLSTLNNLDLSSNSFTGNFELFTSEFFPVFVNASDNLLGPLFQPYPMVLGQSVSRFSLIDIQSNKRSFGFTCPYPSNYPDTVVILRSPCLPSWTDFGMYCGFGIGGQLVAFGLYLLLYQLGVQKAKLQTTIFFCNWAATVASLFLDLVCFQTMFKDMLLVTDHCTRMNLFTLFSPFVDPWVGMPDSEPNTTFVDWIQDYVTYGGTTFSDPSAILNMNEFRDFCQKVPECGLDSFGTQCLIANPALAQSGKVAFPIFFASLIMTMVVRGLLELGHVTFIIISLWRRSILFGEYGAIFIGSSAVSPFVFLLTGTRVEFNNMILHRHARLSHHQFMFELVHSIVLISLPLLIATTYYTIVVAQTGLTALSLLSIMFSFLKACVLMGQAIHVWIQSHNAPEPSISTFAPNIELALTANSLYDPKPTTDQTSSTEFSDQNIASTIADPATFTDGDESKVPSRQKTAKRSSLVLLPDFRRRSQLLFASTRPSLTASTLPLTVIPISDDTTIDSCQIPSGLPIVPITDSHRNSRDASIAIAVPDPGNLVNSADTSGLPPKKRFSAVRRDSSRLPPPPPPIPTESPSQSGIHCLEPVVSGLQSNVVDSVIDAQQTAVAVRAPPAVRRDSSRFRSDPPPPPTITSATVPQS